MSKILFNTAKWSLIPYVFAVINALVYKQQSYKYNRSIFMKNRSESEMYKHIPLCLVTGHTRSYNSSYLRLPPKLSL